MNRFYPLAFLAIALLVNINTWATPLDSALHAAMVIKEANQRYQALNKLGDQIVAATNNQIIAYDKATLDVSIILHKDTAVIGSYVNLAGDYKNTGQYDLALMASLKAVTMAEQRHIPKRMIEAYIITSGIYQMTGQITNSDKDLDEALGYAGKAMATCKTYELHSYEPGVLGAIASIYDVKKQHSKAIAFYREAVALNVNNVNKQQLESSYINLGISLKNNKNFEEALYYYSLAGKISDSLGDNFTRLVLNVNTANLYFEMGKLPEAERLGLITLKELELQQLDEVKIDLYNLMHRLYRKQKRYEDALHYSDALLLLKDSLFNKEKTARIVDMQEKYQSGVKDEQITNQTATISFAKKQNTYMWLGIGALAGIGALTYTNQRRTKKLNKQIIEQKQELQKVNDIKDHLFSAIGHDLQSPLNSLTSFTVLLDDAQLPPETLHAYVTELKHTLGRTTGLLENLLHFARTQLQAYHPTIQPVNISDAIEEAVQLMQPGIRKKELKIINNLSPDSVAIADIDMIGLIFRNLLSNAIKYSYDGGLVTIADAIHDGFLYTTITDEGIGMQPAAIASFNSPIMQQPMNSSLGTRQEKGSGLGLMLCRIFIKVMQGQMLVESTEGKGTSFTVVLSVA